MEMEVTFGLAAAVVGAVLSASAMLFAAAACNRLDEVVKVLIQARREREQYDREHNAVVREAFKEVLSGLPQKLEQAIRPLSAADAIRQKANREELAALKEAVNEAAKAAALPGMRMAEVLTQLEGAIRTVQVEATAALEESLDRFCREAKEAVRAEVCRGEVEPARPKEVQSDWVADWLHGLGDPNLTGIPEVDDPMRLARWFPWIGHLPPVMRTVRDLRKYKNCPQDLLELHQVGPVRYAALLALLEKL